MTSSNRVSIAGRRPVLVVAITSSVSSVLLRGQLQCMRERGFDVHLLSSPGTEARELAASEAITLHELPMERDPRLGRDLVSLIQLVRLLRSLRPDIINYGTPKAGLLCALAAWACRIRVRIYTLRGFRHESATGVLCRVLITLERLTCRISHAVICISPSVRDLAIVQRITSPSKLRVLGNGSSNGFDLKRFDAGRFDDADRRQKRARLSIPEDALVIGFVGRLIPRKGVEDLLEAWQLLRSHDVRVRLLLVGPYESAQPLALASQELIDRDQRIHQVDFVPDVEAYLAVMNVFVLPAHWEGFGNVLVEAASMGLPVVSTTGTGTRDAVSDGFNGILVPPKDVDAITAAIRSYLESPALRRKHGTNGREWAAGFTHERVWNAMAACYVELLNQRATGECG